MTFQQRLDSLQPYVIGIRKESNIQLLDVVLKPTWTIPESTLIEATKGKGVEGLNYYMIYSKQDGIGIDELFDFVEEIIKVNKEKEDKLQLLKDKVEELKKIFKNNTLVDLKNLKFVLNEVGDFSVEDVDIGGIVEEVKTNPHIVKPPEHIEQVINQSPNINKSSEEIEEDLAIQRAEAFRKQNLIKKQEKLINNVGKPKQDNVKEKIVLEDYSIPNELLQGDCNCAEDQFCQRCMDRKAM